MMMSHYITVILSVIVLKVIILSVWMQNIVILSVVASTRKIRKKRFLA